jgi:hypothetical protein
MQVGSNRDARHTVPDRAFMDGRGREPPAWRTLFRRAPIRVPWCPTRRRGAALLLYACLGVLGIAAPAQAQVVIYEETFDVGNGSVATPRLVNTYIGPAPNNIAYTADNDWLTICDGWVTAWNAPTNPAAPVASCGTALSWNYAQEVPQALGVYRGLPLTGAARDNLAITAFTSGNAASNTIILQNTVPIPLPGLPPGGTGRFVTIRLTGAAASCTNPGAGPPLVRFYFVNGSTETPMGLGNINLCTDGINPMTVIVEARGAALATPIRVVDILPLGATPNELVTGPITFRIRNFQPSGSGNDWGFDNFTFLDVSPTLSKSVPGIRYVGVAMPLTFTITNTPQDNATKTGWAFSDGLPAGVLVAPTPGIANTCGGTVSAAAGSNVISLTNGSLPAGTAGGTPTTCTLTVNVVSNVAGVYSNGAANIATSTALNLPPAPISMEWVINRLTLTKISLGQSDSFVFNGNNGIAGHTITTTAAGAPGTAGPQQTLTVASTTANTTIAETPPPGWALTAASCTGLASGQSATFAGNVVTLPFAGLAAVSGGRAVACTITNTLTANLSITKSNTYTPAQPSDLPNDTVLSKSSTTYTLVVTNNGPGAVTGEVVRDTPVSGLTCPSGNAVTISGNGVPAGSFTIANLTGAGIALGTLGVGQSTTLRFTCTVQ